MALFLGHLLERNASVNLISRRTAEEVLARQALPSLAALSLVPAGEAPRVLDIGSGGGFPGIPLRILRPGIRLDLVEATRNKCRFLEECVDQLGWTDARVHWCRIESPHRDLVARRPFDLAVARAVGQEELLARSVVRLLAERAAAWTFVPPGQGDVDWRGIDGEPVTALRRLRPPPEPMPSS
jgi:16S rRNA (guanine527-N7)-methyltransferase